MASLRRKFIYLLLALILALALSACVRPFGQSEDEQAAQATQEAEAQTAEQAEEDTQAVEVTSEAAEEVVEPEGEAEEAPPEEMEGEAAEEVEEAVPAEEAGETPETEEEAPAVEETPSPEGEAEAVEGEAEVSEEPTEEAAAEEAVAEEAMVEEAAAEEEMAEEAEAEESESATLPATHTVAPGENLFRIGLIYGLSWVPLAVYNDIPNPNLIYTGQVIRIPGGQEPPTESAPEGATYTNYVVKPGDTVYKISRAFGVDPQEIVEANGLVNPNLIYAGQVLKIPTG
jgi:LysM repeat protein